MENRPVDFSLFKKIDKVKFMGSRIFKRDRNVMSPGWLVGHWLVQ